MLLQVLVLVLDPGMVHEKKSCTMKNHVSAFESSFRITNLSSENFPGKSIILIDPRVGSQQLLLKHLSNMTTYHNPLSQTQIIYQVCRDTRFKPCDTMPRTLGHLDTSDIQSRRCAFCMFLIPIYSMSII